MSFFKKKYIVVYKILKAWESSASGKVHHLIATKYPLCFIFLVIMCLTNLSYLKKNSNQCWTVKVLNLYLDTIGVEALNMYTPLQRTGSSAVCMLRPIYMLFSWAFVLSTSLHKLWQWQWGNSLSFSSFKPVAVTDHTSTLQELLWTIWFSSGIYTTGNSDGDHPPDVLLATTTMFCTSIAPYGLWQIPVRWTPLKIPQELWTHKLGI